MRIWTAATAMALVFMIGLAPARAADKAKDLIVGKWESEKDKQKFTVEFAKDGKMSISGKMGDMELVIKGTYRFTADDILEVTLEFMGEKKTEKLTVTKIDKDAMTLVDEKKEEDKFKRVK